MHALGKRAKGQTFREFESPPFRQKVLMAITNPIIQEIKDRINIVDFISGYIPTKKAGANYKASCPFHNEKTASLMISPSKQIWHCFGCGEGGDIFGFLMRYENLEFREALKVLADKAGVQLPKYGTENKEEDAYREKLLKINDASARFYNEVLKKASAADTAREYLKGRGLSGETINEWQIGFAPRDSHALEKFLHSKGVSEKEYLDSGVGAKSASGEYYDRFFNRITFPIKNYTGDVVGFTARVLEADVKAAKYINSPETAIYNKSRVIFGLFQAKNEIRKQDFAVVVEGNMDVVSCHQAGFKNVVASSGTAFTPEQLSSLARLTKNLKFAFDSDQAGLSATRRTLGLALEQGFNVYILKIADAKDPDELVRKNPEAFKDAVEHAPSYLDYFFEKAFQDFNPNSVEQKKKIAAELTPLIQQLTDPLEVAHYAKNMATMLGVDEKTVYAMLQKKPQVNRASQSTPKQETAEGEIKQFRLVKPQSFYLEQKILGYFLLNKKYADLLREQVSPDDFLDQEIKEEFIAQLNGAGNENLSELAKMALFVVESEYTQLDNSLAFERELDQVLKTFKNNALKIKMKNLTTEMVVAEKIKDKEKLARLNQEFLQLSKELNSGE